MTDTTKTTETKTSIACTTKTKSTQQVKISGVGHFLVHFRRASKHGYDGSFGFDWLRDEYIYDMKFVEQDVANNIFIKKRLYRGEVKELLKEYLGFQSPTKGYTSITEIDGVPSIYSTTNNGREPYIPAWLSIYPKDSGIQLHSNGVELYLTVEQEETIKQEEACSDIPLQGDGIVLEFVASDELEVLLIGRIKTETEAKIKLKPNEMMLQDLLNTTRQEMNLKCFDNAVFSKKVFYYENIPANYQDQYPHIKITSKTSFSEPKFVKVVAKTKDGKTKDVGLLMVYPNDKILSAEIVYVGFSATPNIDPKQQNKPLPLPLPLFLDNTLKNLGFNQALVRCNLSDPEPFNVYDKRVQLEEKANNRSITPEDSYRLKKVKEFLNKYSVNYKFNKSQGDKSIDLKRDMVNLYEIFKFSLVQKGDSYVLEDSLDSIDNKKTYVIISEYQVTNSENGTQVGGSVLTTEVRCSKSESCETKISYSNVVVLFSALGMTEKTHIHEIGHTFWLPHTFEEEGLPKPKHCFYQGYTDNIMDYSWIPKTDTPNEFSEYMRSFFKWQWDIIRSDKSLEDFTPLN